MWRHQHQPTLLANGRLLMFDNQGAGKVRSRVIEVDRHNGAIAWEYLGEPDAPLSSRTLGAVQRLPNGNLLVTDSYRGRALEVLQGSSREDRARATERPGRNRGLGHRSSLSRPRL